MTSALDLINDAAVFAGCGDIFNPLKAEESSLYLRLLNNLLDAESTQEYTIFDWGEGTIPLVPPTATYNTIVSMTPSASPFIVERMTVVDSSGFTHPMREVGLEEWADIDWKASPGRPSVWYFETGAATVGGTVNLWQAPSFAGDVLHVWYGVQLQQFAGLSNTLVAPYGFEMFIKTSLGELIAMWNRKALSPDQAKAILKYREFVRYAPIKVLDMPVPSESMVRYYNIYTDNQ